jgi:RND family efflux transporter MFP subunit
VHQRETALEQAKSQLAVEQGQQEVAKREWEVFQKEAKDLAEEADPSLALRKPQLASARAQVEAAKSQLEQARLNLRRTTVQAPFDALVVEESVSVGDLASTQAPVATLVATDTFWVRLKIPPSKISYVDIPEVNAERGSKVEIGFDTGETNVDREGRVRRLVGGLDRGGRLARIIVAIEDPLGLESGDGEREFRGVPLLLDSYVDARIRGGTESELVELPRSGLRDGDQAYVYDDGTLEIREVEIAWRRTDSVLIESGLEDGERVVVGPMPDPVEGMELRLAGADEDSPDDASSNGNAESSGDTEGEQTEENTP